ncbi:MAG: hypothetical protein V4550_19950 [Gemmatimonadota bacterium]
MIRPSRWTRFLTVFFAAVQFALPATLSVSDAVDAIDRRNAYSHVEDESRTACRPPHSADCVVCQYLSVLMVGTSADPLEVPRRLTGGLAEFSAPSTESLRGHGYLSRAPPDQLV